MGRQTKVFALDQKLGEQTPHLMPSSRAMPSKEIAINTAESCPLRVKRQPAPGLTYLNGLPVKSVHINMCGRAAGMSLFDYVAIGVLVGLALWAGVLLYLRRKM
jgi:hypothetical protein